MLRANQIRLSGPKLAGSAAARGFALNLTAWTLLFGVALAVPAAATPPPPPPPINVNLLTTYAGPQVANVAGPEVGEPVPERAKFYLRAPESVEAGKPITVEIVRERRDGRAHIVGMKFEPEGLVRNAPTSITIDDASDGWKGDIATVADVQGGWPQKLSILLMPGDTAPEIGVPRMVGVILTEPPMPASFIVKGPQNVTQRGSDVVFSVARQGGAGEARVQYNVTQGGNLVATGELVFGEGGAPQNLGFSNYDQCGEPLSFALLGVQGETNATATFPAELPPACLYDDGGGGGGGGIPDDWWPWVLIPLALPVLWFVKRLIWPPKPPDPIAPPLTDPHEPDPSPAAELHSSFKIKPGSPSFPSGQPKLRQPDIKHFMRITFGKSTCPNPLPVREKQHG